MTYAGVMTGFQPQLWIDRAGEAVSWYQQAFGATVLHQVGDDDDIVAQLGVNGAAFWVARADPAMKRFSPDRLGGPDGADGADGADSTLPLLRGLIRTGRASQVPPARRCSRRSAGRSASIENMQISSMKLA